MAKLDQMECEACRVGAPLVTDQEMPELLAQIPEWSVLEREGIKQLERRFQCKNFVDALAFTNSVGELAEAFAHHPAILTEWGATTVTWWTHKIKGLHKNDFIMAAKTDALFEEAD